MMCVAIITKMCWVWAHLRQWPIYTPSRIRAGDRQSAKKKSALNLQPPGWRSVSSWGNPATMMRFCVTKIRSRTFSPGKIKKKPQPTWLPSTVFLSEAIVQNVELQFLLRILTGGYGYQPSNWVVWKNPIGGLRKIWHPGTHPFFRTPFGESQVYILYSYVQSRVYLCSYCAHWWKTTQALQFTKTSILCRWTATRRPPPKSWWHGMQHKVQHAVFQPVVSSTYQANQCFHIPPCDSWVHHPISGNIPLPSNMLNSNRGTLIPLISSWMSSMTCWWTNQDGKNEQGTTGIKKMAGEPPKPGILHQPGFHGIFRERL